MANKRLENNVTVCGRVYEHSLEFKTVKREDSPNFGTQFIGGKLKVATDEEGVNVVEINYTYVVPTFKSGNSNRNYKVLETIINNPERCWVKGGKDNAYFVKVSTSIGLNDFVNRDGEIASGKILDGGFISILDTNAQCDGEASFTVDMLITGFALKEPENGKPYGVVSGAIFNFRKDILPVSFTINDEEGIAFFEGEEPSASNPSFYKITGEYLNQTVERVKQVEMMWGAPKVQKTTYKNKAWIITGIATAELIFDEDEEALLKPSEVKEAMQNREVHLAEVRAQHEEYVQNQAAKSNTAPSAATPVGDSGFKF